MAPAPRRGRASQALRPLEAKSFRLNYLHPEDRTRELTTDEAFLVPRKFSGGSRLAVDLSPIDFPGSSQPIVSANMTAVTGRRMATTIAQYGGLGILPQDMPVQRAADIAQSVKAHDPRYDVPILLGGEDAAGKAKELIGKRAHEMALVVDDERCLLGVVTAVDLGNVQNDTPLLDVVRTETINLEANIDFRSAYLKLEKERLHAAPVVDDDRRVVGVLTRQGALMRSVLPPSEDADGRLVLGAAIGINAEIEARAVALVDAGVDVLVLDTAHGHQDPMIEAIRSVRNAVGEKIPIVAGNVCTAEGALALADAGADVVKVGVGPGAMCETRIKAGVGRPNLSAVRDCAEALGERGKHVWADGGVRYPRDLALYLAAGASRVMLGTALAGTHESPADLMYDDEGRPFKVNYGMASARAVQLRTRDLDPFEKARRGLFEEGISSSKVYLREGQQSVALVLKYFLSGLQSALTYADATDLTSFREQALIGVQSTAGFVEGTPHGKVR